MPLAVPPIVKLLKDLVCTWQFVIAWILLLTGGFLLQQLSDSQQRTICNTYHTTIQPKIEHELDQLLEKQEQSKAAANDSSVRPSPATTASTVPATLPAYEFNIRQTTLDAVHNYFCGHPEDRKNTGSWHQPTWDEAKLVVPGSLVLALIATAMLPISVGRAQITARVNGAVAIANSSQAPAGPAAPVQLIASRYLELAISIRQFRVAIVYALLSGVATELVRPSFTTVTSAWSSGRNPWHLIAIAICAIASALWGTYGFSRSPVRTSVLALRLGFAAIFIAGLIATAISLPYQVLRPAEMLPMSDVQVLVVLALRLFALPLVACGAVLICRPALRSI